MSKFRLSGAVISIAAAGVLAGCGGGGSAASNNVAHPLVRQFSPSMSPIDFNTGQANPTFTDGNLAVSTDPAYPGEIVVFFQTGTAIDPATVFVGGNPTLGIDYSAFQVLQYIPGTGNVPLPYSQVIVENDKIRFVPATLPLPNGQYSIGVFGNLKSTEGHPVDNAPAPGFPKLRSLFDHSSLPSNGFEIIWRADPALGGLPFGSQVQLTVVGSDGGANGAPIRDRSDNPLAVSYQFQFQTIAPPVLP